MKFNKRKKSSFKVPVTALFVLLAVIGIGYAAVNVELKVAGTTIIESGSWDVHFGEYEVFNDTFEDNEEVKVSDDKASISMKVNLETIKDSFRVDIPIENDGQMDAVLNMFELSEINPEQRDYLEFYALYDDGTEIVLGDKLLSGESKVISIYIKYKDGITFEEISKETDYLTLKATINYGQLMKNKKK